MPARLHAVIVANSGATARTQLLKTITAVQAQTRLPDAVTLVVCGDATTARESAAVGGLVEGIIEARSGTSYAQAVELAMPRVAEGSALWLLAQDTVPAPTALAQLSGALERSPSAALAAPKLVRSDDEREIVSFGVSMTALGRSVELAEGELDQGQRDGDDEALGADIRGILIRGEVRRALAVDDALAGADEGLDLGVRARLGGGRVVLAPGARIAVAPEGPAALPRRTASRAYATRLAQLHRRLSYAPAAAVPLHWLTLLPLALWRSIAHLVAKRPAAVLPEWGAALVAMFRFGAVSRSRRRIRSFRTASWAHIAPLRVTREDLRRRLDDGHGSERGAISELRFFSGGGAWTVLGALLVSIASFTTLLAWPALAGGALLPLRDTVAGLWQEAAWGIRQIGVDVVGPADPFSAVLALLGSLWPATPSFALVLLWILALPLAVLGAWFAATRVTDRSGIRIFIAVAWALAPTFLTALVDGRPAGVLVHLLLPWLFHSAAVAHRSWGAAGAASVLLAAVTACSPSLAPALAVLWVVALVIVLAGRRVRGALRLIWLLIPTAALFLPLAARRLREGNVFALFADPAQVWAGPQAGADAAGRAALATGFPTTDFGGWTQIIDPAIGAWSPVLLAPLALLALASALAPRWRAGIVLLVVALAGLATAFAAVGITIGFVEGAAVALWPGAGLSLAWAGVVGAAGVALDTLLAAPRVRGIAAVVAGLALAVSAVPALTAFHTDRSELRQGATTTLPALIETTAQADQGIGTLVITPLGSDSIATRVVWGSSETLGAQSTLLSTAAEPQGTDISALAVDLISPRDFDAAAELAKLGIRFVVIADPAETEGARALSLEAAIALDERPGFVKAGVLWRLADTSTAARAEATTAQDGITRGVMTLQLVVLLIALLLAVPTRASRRAARAVPRIVGRGPGETPEAVDPAETVEAGETLSSAAGSDGEDDTVAEPVEAPEAVEAAEPVETADSDAPEPEAPDPVETSEPEASESEAPDPVETPGSEAPGPEASEPEASEPEASEPEATAPEASEEDER